MPIQNDGKVHCRGNCVQKDKANTRETEQESKKVSKLV